MLVIGWKTQSPYKEYFICEVAMDIGAVAS